MDIIKGASYKGLHYGIVIGTTKKLMFSPFADAQAEFFLMDPKEKKERLGLWYGTTGDEHWPIVSEKHRWTIGKKDENKVIVVRALEGITEQEFVHAFREKVKVREGTYKMWGMRGKSSIFGTLKGTYAGTIYLDGEVLTTSDARKRETRAKRHGAYISGKSPFDIKCDCDHFKYMGEKQGENIFLYRCWHLATLGKLPLRYPKLVRGSKTRKKEGIEYFQPFDSSSIFDALFDYYVNGTTQFDIERKMMERYEDEERINPRLIRLLEQGKASFEVVVQKQRVSKSPSLTELIMKFKDEMKEEGFERQGTVFENPGFDFETICDDYKKEDESKRLMLREDIPPIVIRRWDSRKTVLLNKPIDWNGHPIKGLYKTAWQRKIDPKTRKKTNLVHELPRHIPVALIPEYRRTIERDYEGGIKKLKKMLEINKVDKNHDAWKL